MASPEAGQVFYSRRPDPSPSVANHPRPIPHLAFERRLRPSRCRASFGTPTATTTPTRMPQPPIVARSRIVITRHTRRIAGAFVDLGGAALLRRCAGQAGGLGDDALGGGTTLRAGAGQVAVGQAAQRVELAAVLAGVVIGGHQSLLHKKIKAGRHSGPRKAASYLSYEIGMSMLPSRYLTGPEAFGLMSNSKICVGSHRVAQALGTSTTPLIWPCTGAVPRME